MIEDRSDDDFSVSRLLVDLMRMRAADVSQLEAALLKPAPASTLQWDDFEHLQERGLAETLVRAAVQKREGVNILLHGAPGTGKSEFARALADRIGLTAIFIGETDEQGGEPTRRERLAHLSMVRALTPAGAARLLVVDEADDVMLPPFGSERQSSSKLWLNQLVENSVTPTIWIVNHASVLGAPVIRRMAFASHFELPPLKVRSRVAERHAARAGIALLAGEAEKLGSLEVSPAVTANGLKAARLAGGGVRTALVAVRSVQRALGGSAKPEIFETAHFDPALSRADTDLVGLAQSLTTQEQRRWSMVLSGPPGTGKSAYARYLASACGLEVIQKRASDLLNMFVGGTERAIADAFQQAADAGALLILDEADSMLRDRRSADRGWEVSMVNEMLSWMEQHPMPFVATTNLMDTLDSATSRRFLFKIAFDYLDQERSKQLFQRTFGVSAPSSLEHLEMLTPADFHVVARRASLLGVDGKDAIFAMLRQEIESRPGMKAKSVGFSIVNARPRTDRVSISK